MDHVLRGRARALPHARACRALRGDDGPRPRRAQGFAVQAANPKALAFFVALLPQFVDPAAPVATQILILGLSSQLIETGVLSFYIWLTQRARGFAVDRLGVLAKRIAGGLLVVAGARLALIR
jgi:homoserine/homoserine lactone efflux protein